MIKRYYIKPVSITNSKTGDVIGEELYESDDGEWCKYEDYDEARRIWQETSNDEINTMKKFKKGTIVVFEPKTLNQDYWKNLSKEDKIKYYGSLGYGKEKFQFFVFLCEIRNAPGHCVLVSLEDQHIETMRHTNNFREVTEKEF